VPVSEHNAGQCLDLDILQRGALDLGEVADLRLGEFDVVDRLRRDLGNECGDLILGEAKARWRPFVEALAELAHRRIAALGDIGDDRLDRAANLGVGLFVLAGESRSFDVAGHHFLLFKDLIPRARIDGGNQRPRLARARRKGIRAKLLRFMDSAFEKQEGAGGGRWMGNGFQDRQHFQGIIWGGSEDFMFSIRSCQG
jgi:hypothetical protein